MTRHSCKLFFFNDTATTEIYTLSLHDALPIGRPTGWAARRPAASPPRRPAAGRRARWPRWPRCGGVGGGTALGRESTRLNPRHAHISYAVFCLEKKKPIYRTLPIAVYHLRTCS